MVLFAIIETAIDRSNFWAPFTTVYRICKTEKDAMKILRDMADLCKSTHSIGNGDYYMSPNLSSDEKTLSLFYHQECVLGQYTNYDLEFKIVQINDASSLFKDSPF